MMTGYVSYAYGGSSSSSSNLSALAPPFTVDRSAVPKPVLNPLVDLTEPTYAAVSSNHSVRNWLNSHIPTPEFDTMPSLNACGYSSSTTDVLPLPVNPLASGSIDPILYGQSPSGLVETKPYYPSYVSPTIDHGGPVVVPHQSGYDLLSTTHVATSNGSSHDAYTQSLSGLEHVPEWGKSWDGFADWQPSKQVQSDWGFCFTENYVNQGFYESNIMSKFEDASHGINVVGSKNLIEPASTGQLDYLSILGKNPKSIPTDCPTASTLASTSIVPKTYPQIPSIKWVNSSNGQMLDSTSYEKCPTNHDTGSNDSASIMESFPAILIRSPTKDSRPLKNMISGSDGDHKDFAVDCPSNVKEPYPYISSEGKVHFDASQLSFHLKQIDHMSAEFSSIKNGELPSDKCVSGNASDDFFRAKCQVPHTSLDSFNVPINCNEVIDSVEKFSESLDHYNPAVDSPCWKGASLSHLSAFECFEPMTPRNMERLEACSGLNLQGSQIFPLAANDASKVFPGKPAESSVHQDGESLENSFVPSLKRPSVAISLFKEGIDDATKCGLHHAKTSYCDGIQISDDIHEPAKEHSLSDKSIHNFHIEPLGTGQQRFEEGKSTSEKNCELGAGVTDVGMNMNDGPDDCSSHVPFHATENVLCSPPSAEDNPTKLTKSRGKSTLNSHVQMLVNTMHNLSELLLFHCSNDACELKQEDCEVLKDVISNLDSCISKNVERMTSTRESLIPQNPTFQFSGRLSKLCKEPLENQQVQKGEEHEIVSGEQDEKLSNFVSVRSAADMVEDDNMTQAIKKVLSDNFHGEDETQPQILLYKNLWLEAEASLCSVNYMARYNRMKVEMEKCNSPKTNVLQENTMVMENLSRSKVSSDPYTIGTLAADTKAGPIPDISLPELSILGRSSHVDDTAARFQILSSRVDDPNSVNTSAVEKLSSSKILPDLNKVDKLTQEMKDSAKPAMSTQDLPMLNTISQADDVEASVMARFCILKHRVDTSSSTDTEDHQPESIDLGLAGLRSYWPTDKDSDDRILDVNMEPILQGRAANSSEDKSTVKEFHLFVNDNPLTQSRMTSRLGGQPHPGWNDASSSDWEHVLKEELAGLNC